MKPTCLVQISERYIAIATGFLNDKSAVEIVNIYTGKRQEGGLLRHHKDMIDSVKVVDLDYFMNKDENSLSITEREKKKNKTFRNPYIKWLLTMGRDN